MIREEKSEQLQQQQSNDDDDDEFFTGKIQINKRQNTSWLIIPRKLSIRYKLDKRTNVLMLPQKDGIMLKGLLV